MGATNNISTIVAVGVLKVLGIAAGLISLGILANYVARWIGHTPGPDPMTSARHQSKRFKRIMARM